MRRNLLTLIAVVFAVLFVIYVWPTAWRYEQVNGRLIRVSRFTDRVQRITTDGWRDLKDGL